MNVSLLYMVFIDNLSPNLKKKRYNRMIPPLSVASFFLVPFYPSVPALSLEASEAAASTMLRHWLVNKFD